jgi:hypothetical protein
MTHPTQFSPIRDTEEVKLFVCVGCHRTVGILGVRWVDCLSVRVQAQFVWEQHVRKNQVTARPARAAIHKAGIYVLFPTPIIRRVG